MNAGILQFKPVRGEVETNLKTIKRFLGRRRFDLAVIPELSTTGYNFSTRDEIWSLAETRRGRSFQFFEKLTVKTGGAIVWGLAEKSKNKLYNTAVMTTPAGDHYLYRKTHLFFREKELFDPGDTGFRVFDWLKTKIGLMICFDWIFPEAARSLALKKAQIICHPSNLVMTYCQDAMVTRSLENGLFCLTANRVGTEKIPDLSLTFTGHSQITDPKGHRILSFSGAEQAFKSVKIRPELSDIKNVNRYNHLITDRRVDYYTL
jgi:predicted amidohydrolase